MVVASDLDRVRIEACWYKKGELGEVMTKSPYSAAAMASRAVIGESEVKKKVRSVDRTNK